MTLTRKELTLFTNVTKLEKFVDHEVCVSSEFEKSEKSQKNTFRQGENLRGATNPLVPRTSPLETRVD